MQGNTTPLKKSLIEGASISFLFRIELARLLWIFGCLHHFLTCPRHFHSDNLKQANTI